MKGFSVVAVLMALVLGTFACTSGNGSQDEQHVQHAIERIVQNDTVSYAASGDGTLRDKVANYYAKRDHRPAWVATGDSEDRIRDVLNLFCQADAEGLNRHDYANALLQQRLDAAFAEDFESDSLRAQALAQLDLALTSTLFDYASDALTGRIDPNSFGSGWNTPVHEINLLDVIGDTTTAASLEQLSQQLNDRHDQYHKLKAALERYRQIAAAGGWPEVPSGEAIKEGDRGTRVASLIQRLAASGDIDSSLVATSPDSVRYTADVAAAVARFQRRHGILADSIAGETVIERMNAPVEQRIRQIELNLERWRWIPPHLGSRYVYVNVPAFELHAFEGGKEVLSMAVVVGEQYNDQATPVFSDTMEYVVFNPYWNVPESIAAEEIVPDARRNSGYLEQNEFEIVTSWSDNAEVLPPTPQNLDRVEDGTYRIRQKPGPQNALGRIKFMFPNEFDIYLHDTPEQHLFDRPQRAYSHGCIRVEKPIEFGEFVFTSSEWTAAKIQEQIQSTEQFTESLDSPLPVYILYWTAFVDNDGLVNFREDIYGNDEALDNALRAQMPQAQAVACESLAAPLES